MENNKNKLHLTLTDNETGQVIFDDNIQYVIMTLFQDRQPEKDIVKGMVYGKATEFQQFGALQSLDRLREDMLERHPKFRNLLEIAKVLGLDKEGFEIEKGEK